MPDNTAEQLAILAQNVGELTEHLERVREGLEMAGVSVTFGRGGVISRIVGIQLDNVTGLGLMNRREHTVLYRGDGFVVYACAERQLGPGTVEGAELFLHPDDQSGVWLDADDVSKLVTVLSEWHEQQMLLRLDRLKASR